jgi:hypothetical protein
VDSHSHQCDHHHRARPRQTCTQQQELRLSVEALSGFHRFSSPTLYRSYLWQLCEQEHADMRTAMRLLLCLGVVCILVHSAAASCAACCATPSNTTACADASPGTSTGKCCGYNGNNINSPVCCSTLDTCRYSTDVYNSPSYTCSNGISSCYSCCTGSDQLCVTAFRGERGVCCGLIRSTSFCCGDPRDFSAYQYPECTLSANMPSYNCEIAEVSLSTKLGLGLGFGIPVFLILVAILWCKRPGGCCAISTAIVSNGTV